MGGVGAETVQANAKGKGHRRSPTKFVPLHYLGKWTYILLGHVHEVKPIQGYYKRNRHFQSFIEAKVWLI
jgi:hypothetical protein